MGRATHRPQFQYHPATSARAGTKSPLPADEVLLDAMVRGYTETGDFNIDKQKLKFHYLPSDKTSWATIKQRHAAERGSGKFEELRRQAREMVLGSTIAPAQKALPYPGDDAVLIAHDLYRLSHEGKAAQAKGNEYLPEGGMSWTQVIKHLRERGMTLGMLHDQFVSAIREKPEAAPRISARGVFFRAANYIVSRRGSSFNFIAAMRQDEAHDIAAAFHDRAVGGYQAFTRGMERPPASTVDFLLASGLIEQRGHLIHVAAPDQIDRLMAPHAAPGT